MDARTLCAQRLAFRGSNFRPESWGDYYIRWGIGPLCPQVILGDGTERSGKPGKGKAKFRAFPAAGGLLWFAPQALPVPQRLDTTAPTDESHAPWQHWVSQWERFKKTAEILAEEEIEEYTHAREGEG